MTQTKLEIIGPYTPEHTGPYAIDSAMSEEVLFVKVNIHCIVDGIAFVTTEDLNGPWCAKTSDLMNAREVPAAREVWDVVRKQDRILIGRFENQHDAEKLTRGYHPESSLEVIHLREVLPGEE